MLEILAKVWTGITTVGVAVLSILNWLNKYQIEIDAIALRIQKDSADGKWTNEEKVELGWELFKKKIYPTLDWKIKTILKLKGEESIKKSVTVALDRICKKSHKLKN